MKRLIFSDSHMTTRFEPERFELLKKLINQADQVIIVGDLWDGYLTSFEDFLASEWSKLFPLLKKKKTIYLTGNHDPRSFSDDRVSQFCEKCTETYQFKVGKTTYYCVHGHQLLKHIDGLVPFVRNNFFTNISDTYYRLSTYLFKEKFWKVAKVQNKRLIGYQQSQLPDKVLVTGHTHMQQYVAGKYLNPGIMNYGLAQYVWIEGDDIQVIHRRYNS